MRKIKTFILLGVLGVLLSCAEEKTPLQQLEKQESKVKEQQNELLLGMRLGMPKQEFYDYCAAKNKSEEFMDGGEFHQVLFVYEDEFSSPVDFWFFQEFEDGKIAKQRNKFKFKAWAPWNDQHDAKYLFPEVISFLSTEFGDDFIEIDTGNELLHRVDIDANRRIDVYTKLLDDTYVYMDVVNLRK